MKQWKQETILYVIVSYCNNKKRNFLKSRVRPCDIGSHLFIQLSVKNESVARAVLPKWLLHERYPAGYLLVGPQAFPD